MSQFILTGYFLRVSTGAIINTCNNLAQLRRIKIIIFLKKTIAFDFNQNNYKT